ncbi:hydantoinase B/oxoprolinase family protein, partial [Dactylosporangium sucinum]
RLGSAPPGRSGGGPGRLGGFYRRAADGRVERLPAKNNNVVFRAGEAFIVETTGGGGLGDPRERDVVAVALDVADGRVTAAAAAAAYGVRLAADGTAERL